MTPFQAVWVWLGRWHAVFFWLLKGELLSHCNLLTYSNYVYSNMLYCIYKHFGSPDIHNSEMLEVPDHHVEMMWIFRVPCLTPHRINEVIFPAIRTSITVSPETFSELCDFCEKHNRNLVSSGLNWLELHMKQETFMIYRFAFYWHTHPWHIFMKTKLHIPDHASHKSHVIIHHGFIHL